MTRETILNVEALSKEFVLPRRSPFAVHETVKAVDGVSFAVTAGEVLGLVGELQGRGRRRWAAPCFACWSRVAG